MLVVGRVNGLTVVGWVKTERNPPDTGGRPITGVDLYWVKYGTCTLYMHSRKKVSLDTVFATCQVS